MFVKTWFLPLRVARHGDDRRDSFKPLHGVDYGWKI